MKHFIATALVAMPLVALSASTPRSPRAKPVDQQLFIQSGHATPETTSLGTGIANCPDVTGPNPTRCQVASKVVAEGESDHWGIRFHTTNQIGTHGFVAGPKGGIPEQFDIHFNIENHQSPGPGDAIYGDGSDPTHDYSIITRLPGQNVITVTPAANGDFSVTIPVPQQSPGGLEGFGIFLRTYNNATTEQAYESIRIRITGASQPANCPTPLPGWNDRVRWIIEE